MKPSSPNLIRVMVSSGLARETALSEAKENLGPGTDTTSASLAHIVFALSRNPLYQEELYADLARAGFSTDMSTLEGIPRLKALVKEGIRWAGAAVAMLPRIVPAGGVELHGKFIPQGVRGPGVSPEAPACNDRLSDRCDIVSSLVSSGRGRLSRARAVRPLQVDRRAWSSL